MKKASLISAGIMISTAAMAQKQNIQNASNYLREKDYKQAIEYINMAVADPSTKDDPKTYWVKGNIYMAMQDEPAHKAENPYRESAAAYMKVAELKPTYEKDNVNASLMFDGQLFYNDAVAAYNAKKYDEAYDLSQKTVEIHDMEQGKRFAYSKAFDTVAINAKIIQAYSAYYSNQPDKALPILVDLKNSPIGRDANVYIILSGIYGKQNKDAEQIAIIEEGRKAFPENTNLRTEELNYYIRTGKQDVLMKKLEDAVAAEPNNAVLQYNLANGYNNMAFPKDAAGKELQRPASYADLTAKAEKAYNAALSADPANTDYNYNAGVLYYNEATEINKDMNKITGNTAADQKKYEELKAQRDAMFSKAIPYLQKAVDVFSAKPSLTNDDKFVYDSSLRALQGIYANLNNLEKSNEMKKLRDSIPH